ncbi:3-phenylpropionate/cinnamic acid dioxygenase subunit beta [Reyranella sp. CPCC 100927]|uniref:aromatic-ring-hydroxylating dioxygenase subunit beta n=1 Tax=Reyranella sp. CPCC 100927 TaxID=2599616 RepID=UPI0011B489BA|nr:3-phenylpropionate/cinnamic acid dioxygenase subunit beta [Reyranella sp. CPCC 100927]TWT13705.1 3-phenylpropionate/cinnamic acid dioxygenase subunit beta [Reyranella sp. CPCC 100927]
MTDWLHHRKVLAALGTTGNGGDAVTSPDLSEKIALQYAVEQFLYREAALLDDRRFDDWLALIADDIHYWMPIRRTVTVENLHLEYAKADGMAYFDDDKSDLKMRVDRLRLNSAWSENPPSRTRHFVSNVRILEVKGPEIALEAAIHLYRSRLNDKIDHWIGKRRDRLRRVGDGFQIVERHIFLDQTVLLSTNFSSLF